MYREQDTVLNYYNKKISKVSQTHVLFIVSLSLIYQNSSPKNPFTYDLPFASHRCLAPPLHRLKIWQCTANRCPLLIPWSFCFVAFYS